MAIITISRGSQSGGAKLAELLGAKLGHRVIGREAVVAAAATAYGITEEHVAHGLREPPGLWSRLTRHAGDYVLAAQAALSELVAQGDAVYHGLAGAFLLAELPGVLKVRLIAPRALRERAVMRELGLARDRAAAYVDEVDGQRARWVRALYGQDWSDPSHYDLVVNLGEMSIETAAGVVAAMVNEPEYRASAELLAAARDFALRARVQAQLRLRSPHGDVAVDVRAKDAVVTLSGGRGFEQERGGIVSFVRAVAGVERVVLAGEEPAAEPQADRAVRELMLPLARYPHVRLTATLGHAVGALQQATKAAAGACEVAPRYVMVTDDQGRLCGIVGRRDLLRGLSPVLRGVERALGSVSAMLPRHGGGMDVDIGWDSLFSPAVADSAGESVRTVLREAQGAVSPSDPLAVAVQRMLQHEIDLVPVVDGGEVVGVVRMTDVFGAVAAHVASLGARA